MIVKGLGYVGVKCSDPDSWRSFSVELLGLAETPGPPAAPETVTAGSLFLKLDKRCWRIAVHPAASDGLAYLGWEVGGSAELTQAIGAVERAGTSVQRFDPDECRDRGVREGARFDDPWGNTNELFWGAAADEWPFVSPAGVSGFVTEGVGLGHAFLVVPASWEAANFYETALGFKLTDFFQFGPNAVVFMRTSPRHHSLGFVDLPLPGGPGLNHIMIEAKTITDVGCAYDRVRAAAVPIANSLGEHSNDRMVSFYVQTPSGFNLEFGCNGLMIDESTWTVRQWNGRGDLWGHTGEFMDSVEGSKQDSTNVEAV